MGITTEIQWCDFTWNIARGCTKVSEGCKYCYMMRDGEKFGYDGTVVQKTKTVFDLPLRYKKTRSEVWEGNPLVFTSSLTDFFHPDCDPFRHECWEIIRRCPHLIFLILTKRPERISLVLPYDWRHGFKNVWLGVSIENENNIERMMILQNIPAEKRFISFEPLLGDINFLPFIEFTKADLPKIQWAIIGGESGNDKGKWNYRDCRLEWIENLVQQSNLLGIAPFVKQMGTHLAKEMQLHDRHGGNISEWPKHLQIRTFPK